MDLKNISQVEFESIEAYLSGQFSKDDLVAFEVKLKKDSNFKTKVEEIKTILTGIETQALKEELAIFHKEIEQNSEDRLHTKPKIRYLNWQKITIAAILVLAAGTFWFTKGNSNEQLYAKYFIPDPGLPTTMSSTDNYEFYEAMVDYKQGNYKTAITKWETLQIAKPNNDTLNYFIGVAHLANKNEKLAIEFLEDATENSEFVLANDASYYLGLAYLKSGNIEKAKANFEQSTTKNSRVVLSKLND